MLKATFRNFICDFHINWDIMGPFMKQIKFYMKPILMVLEYLRNVYHYLILYSLSHLKTNTYYKNK